MRHCKPFALPAIGLAALIALLAAGGGVTLAQSPAPAAKPTVAASAPTATPAADEDSDEDIHDIRDIRPPIHIAYSWLWAAYVAGGLGLAGLAFAAWRWYRQSRRKLLYELTLDELGAARVLMGPGKGYQFSIAVSEIIRKYIEKRFQARAAHRTTEEFLHDLLGQSDTELTALAVHQPLLAEFLGHCDLAKFARWQLSVAQMEDMHHSACAFVIETGKPTTSGKPTAPAADKSAATESQSMLLERRST